MPPEEGPAEWRPGCPDCAHLREELATVRAEMRAAVVAYEAKLRGQAELITAQAELFERYATASDAANDPMDAYTPPVEPRP